MLRNAPLSINVDLEFLMGLKGPKPLLEANEPWTNIFRGVEKAPDEAARQEAIRLKGEGYFYKRDSVERVLFPSLGESRPIVADERPTYAALNPMRFRTGAAPSYGVATFHLKPEVARRATFVVEDTFIALQLTHTPENAEKARSLLQTQPGLSDETRAQLLTEGSPLSERFEAILEALREKGTCSGQYLKSELALGGVTEDEGMSISALLIQAFGDREATSRAMATYDNLETLLPSLGDVDVVNLAAAAMDRRLGGLGRVQMQCNYIEAEIQSPVVLSRDVAEIVIIKDMLAAYPDEKLPWLNAVVAVLGGEKPDAQTLAKLSAEEKKELKGIREALGDVRIPVRFEEFQPEIMEKNAMRNAEEDFYREHLDQSRLDAALLAAKDDETLSQMVAERFTDLAQKFLDGAPLFSPEALAHVRTRFEGNVEHDRAHAAELRARNERELVNGALLRAVREEAGENIAKLLESGYALTQGKPELRERLRGYVLGHLDINTAELPRIAASLEAELQSAQR